MPTKGFTLVEALIVMAIAGLIMAVAVPAIDRYLYKSRVVETTVDIGNIASKIRQHEMSKGALPDSLGELGFAGRADSWGFPYEYINLRNAKGNGQARKDQKLAPLNSDYDLYSIGRDGVTAAQLGNKASRDDIVRARDGRFIGLAEEFSP
jgi:general secretion pathway protein G